jgi:hypothetical protein
VLGRWHRDRRCGYGWLRISARDAAIEITATVTGGAHRPPADG